MNKISKQHLARLSNGQRQLYAQRTQQIANWAGEDHWLWQFLKRRLHEPIRSSARQHFIDQTLIEILKQDRRALLLLSANRRILFANNKVEPYLTGKFLDVHADRLRGKTPELEEEFGITLDQLFSNARKESVIAFVLRCGADALHLSVETLPGSGKRSSNSPICIVRFPDIPRFNDISPVLLRGWYGLSPTEAQLAAYFATGTSLNDYAEQHQVSMATVRTQFASIKSKLAANDQAAVVSRVLAATA